MNVPLLSPSGSWLALGVYWLAGKVMPVTVQVMLWTVFGMLGLFTLQMPNVFVLQVAVPT